MTASLRELLLTSALVALTASAFAQNTPTAEQRCEKIVWLEADLGNLLVAYTEKHPQVVRLREEIEAERTALKQTSPGYVCKSPIATPKSQQSEDRTAGVIRHQPNVTQPNTPQPNMPQPNVRSLGCDAVLAAQKRLSEYRRQFVSQPYTDKEDMQAAEVQLRSLEDAMSAEMSMAASQGIDCSAANLLFVCDRIWFFELRQQQAPHPALQATFGQQLAKSAEHLAGERARAASQGIECPATEPKPEKTEPAAAEPER